MWMECLGGDARIESDSVETIIERFLQHAAGAHDWPYPENALRNYARNYAEATVRLTGGTDRLADLGEVTIHPVTGDRIDDWVDFFDHDAFAGNPDWASCYCLSPHVPGTEEESELPWREVRETMKTRLESGSTFGYLAYVDGRPAGWVNASRRTDYGRYATVDPGGPDPASVIGVSCFIIAPPYRRHGLAGMLLDRVIADAAARDTQWIEGYPHIDPDESEAAHFRGSKRSFEARRFEPVEEREEDTVMRRPALE